MTKELFLKEFPALKPEWFDSPNIKGSFINMQPLPLGFCELFFRQFLKSAKINSAYRTKSYNIRVGGVVDSAHCKGLAVDIACGSSKLRYEYLKFMIALKVPRIIIYPQFIHIDWDYDKAFPIISLK